MCINIIPLNIDGLNCFENNIISILNWKINSYELSFVGSWGFLYNYAKINSSDILGDKISSGNQNLIENIINYYGMNVIVHKNKGVQEDMNVIKKQLSEGLPVGIFIDTFYCPWEPDYKSKHDKHFCTIVGINEDGDFICIDSMPIILEAVLSLKDFTDGYGGCVTFDFSKTLVKNFSLKEILNSCISELGLYSDKNNAFRDMRIFADSIENSLNIHSEIDGYTEVWNVPLFANISAIYGRRFQTAKLLKYLHDTFHDDYLLLLLEQFKSIVKKWIIIRGLFYKISMVAGGAKKLISIANKIREVADLEETTADMIYNFLRDERILISKYRFNNTNDKLDISNFDVIFLDITKYFNNKGFGTPEGNFSRTGEYFLTEGLPANKMLDIQGMKFIFPDVIENMYDNISCKGQVIQLSNLHCIGLMLLGCGEWGSFEENLIINYKNGTSEVLEIAFSDWSGDPLFEESIAWQGKYVAKTNSIIKRMGRIFAKVYSINNTDSINSICLPNCENMHIFSISLLKKQ